MSCQTRNGAETQRQVAAPWRRGPWGEPLRQRKLVLPPPNPFLCRRRKSANQPKLTSDQLTSTMSPTLNFDSVLDRTERRRRRLMVAFGSLSLLIAISVLVFFLWRSACFCLFRTSSQVELHPFCARILRFYGKSTKQCPVSDQNRPNPPKRTESLSIFRRHFDLLISSTSRA